MRVFGSLLLAICCASAFPADARNYNAGGSADRCAYEADQLYGTVRQIDQRLQMKRAHIAKCRAARGNRR